MHITTALVMAKLGSRCLSGLDLFGTFIEFRVGIGCLSCGHQNRSDHGLSQASVHEAVVVQNTLSPFAEQIETHNTHNCLPSSSRVVFIVYLSFLLWNSYLDFVQKAESMTSCFHFLTVIQTRQLQKQWCLEQAPVHAGGEPIDIDSHEIKREMAQRCLLPNVSVQNDFDRQGRKEYLDGRPWVV